MRGWQNTVEIVLFEISNSMKPYPSAFHAYTNKSRPVIRFSEPKQHIDEVSNHITPTSQMYTMVFEGSDSRRETVMEALDVGPVTPGVLGGLRVSQKPRRCLQRQRDNSARRSMKVVSEASSRHNKNACVAALQYTVYSIHHTA